MRRRVAELNERRKAEERPTTSVYVGLHVGAVFYGNIGSVDRLDFTVVGPAVNETSRIASMCRSVDRPLLISSAFAVGPAGQASARHLVSVGRFALRGVGRAQDLFTLDPEIVSNFAVKIPRPGLRRIARHMPTMPPRINAVQMRQRSSGGRCNAQD